MVTLTDCPDNTMGVFSNKAHCWKNVVSTNTVLRLCFRTLCSTDDLPRKSEAHCYTLEYIVFRMAQSEPSSGVKGKAIYNKNLSNWFDSFLAGPVLGEHN